MATFKLYHRLANDGVGMTRPGNQMTFEHETWFPGDSGYSAALNALESQGVGYAHKPLIVPYGSTVPYSLIIPDIYPAGCRVQLLRPKGVLNNLVIEEQDQPFVLECTVAGIYQLRLTPLAPDIGFYQIFSLDEAPEE